MEDRFKFRCFGKQGFLKGLKKLFTFEETEQGYYNVKFEGGWINLVEKNDLKIMQCTGLKDKNGKLIYEGDIVEIATEEENAIIKWEEDTANFSIHILNENVIATFDNFWSYQLEVIGNIYENPELLESEK